MNPKEVGRELAASLASAEQGVSDAAVKTLRTAPPSLSDAAAKALAKILRAGGDDAERVCRALADPKAPQFGGKSWHRLFKALMKAQEAGGALGKAASLAMQGFVMRGPDPKYVEKLRKHRPPASANPVFRVLSVAKRIWVWVTFPFGAFFILALTSMSQTSNGVAAIGVGAFLLLLVIIDSFLRRCPSCKALLAGQLLSIVTDGSYTSSVQVSPGRYADQTTNTHRRDWRCVSCGHRWHT